MRPRPVAAAVFAGMLACATAAPRIYQAGDFGAKGDGITDDGPALLAMLDAAVKSGAPAVLRFRSGAVYSLKTGRGRYAFPLENTRDLTIDGAGCEFAVDSSLRFMRLAGARDIRVENLRVDYRPLPFADGIVTAKDSAAGTIDVRVDEGFDLPGEGGPTKSDGEQAFFAVLWHDGPFSTPADPYRTREHFFTDGIRRLDGRTFRLTRAGGARNKLLDRVVPGTWKCSIPVRGIAHCFGPGPNILVERCGPVAFSHVEIWSAPWFAFTIIDNDGPVSFQQVHIRPKPGTRRMTSSWRDGFHVKNNPGPLSWDGCIVQGTNDDAFNLSCHSSTVVDTPAPGQIRIRQNFPLGIARMRPGDTLRFYQTESGTGAGTARILTSTPVRQGFELTLDKTPDAAAAGHTLVWNESTANPDCVLRRCRVDTSCRFRSPVRIEDCDFRAFCWFTAEEVEAPLPRGVRVLRSSFRAGQGNPTLAIAVDGPRFRGRGPAEPVMEDLRFEENTILGAFRLADTRDVVLARNHFPSADHPIELRNIAAVRLIANRRAGRPLVPTDLQTDSPTHEWSVEER